MSLEQLRHDALVRNQFMIDALERQQEREIEALLAAFAARARSIVGNYSVETANQLTKKQLSDLNVALRREIDAIQKRHEREFMTWLRDFAAVVIAIENQIYEETSGTDFIPLLIGAAGVKAFMSRFLNRPLSASGELPVDALRRGFAALRLNVMNTVRGAFVNRISLRDMLRNIVGNRLGFRGGILQRGLRNIGAAIATVIQGAAQLVSEIIGGSFSDEYVWITMEDDRVCPVCAPRHGRRYSRDNPPDPALPPAHYRCRCVVMYVRSLVGIRLFDSFEDWLETQPPQVANFLRRLVGRGLTVAQYREQLALITMEG